MSNLCHSAQTIQSTEASKAFNINVHEALHFSQVNVSYKIISIQRHILNNRKNGNIVYSTVRQMSHRFTVTISDGGSIAYLQFAFFS